MAPGAPEHTCGRVAGWRRRPLALFCWDAVCPQPVSASARSLVYLHAAGRGTGVCRAVTWIPHGPTSPWKKNGPFFGVWAHFWDLALPQLVPGVVLALLPGPRPDLPRHLQGRLAQPRVCRMVAPGGHGALALGCVLSVYGGGLFFKAPLPSGSPKSLALGASDAPNRELIHLVSPTLKHRHCSLNGVGSPPPVSSCLPQLPWAEFTFN